MQVARNFVILIEITNICYKILQRFVRINKKQTAMKDRLPDVGYWHSYPQKRMAAAASSVVGSTMGWVSFRASAATGSSVQPRIK